MVRISLAIGIFNAAMIYFPFTSNRFGELYGLANLNTLGYFMIPYYLTTKIKLMPVKKRLLLSSGVCISCYCVNNFFKVKSN